jgi:hypothetical protein
MDISLLSLGIFDTYFYISINRDIYLLPRNPYYEITLTLIIILTLTLIQITLTRSNSNSNSIIHPPLFFFKYQIPNKYTNKIKLLTYSFLLIIYRGGPYYITNKPLEISIILHNNLGIL